MTRRDERCGDGRRAAGNTRDDSMPDLVDDDEHFDVSVGVSTGTALFFVQI